MYVNGLALKSKIILTIVLDPQMKNHGTVLDLIRGWLSSLISLWKDRSYLCLILSSCKKPNALKEINSGPF